MSVDTGHTMGVTAEEITQALRDAQSDGAEPTTWTWDEPDGRPAAWTAFGEDK